MSQGTAIATSQNGWANATFRCTRYAPNYPAFQGQNLFAGLPIELNPLPSNCEVNTAITEFISMERKLLYITDLLGRKTKGTKNELLFYIYNNGTVEKIITLDK